jgi:hypothetical protein
LHEPEIKADDKGKLRALLPDPFAVPDITVSATGPSAHLPGDVFQLCEGLES